MAGISCCLTVSICHVPRTTPAPIGSGFLSCVLILGAPTTPALDLRETKALGAFVRRLDDVGPIRAFGGRRRWALHVHDSRLRHWHQRHVGIAAREHPGLKALGLPLAGLEPARDALALERAEGNPYANVLVTTEALAKDPRVQRLATLLTSADVAAFIRSRYRGSVIPVRNS